MAAFDNCYTYINFFIFVCVCVSLGWNNFIILCLFFSLQNVREYFCSGKGDKLIVAPSILRLKNLSLFESCDMIWSGFFFFIDTFNKTERAQRRGESKGF